MTHDIKTIDFDSFVDFLFDHPVADRDKNEEPWYWAFDLEIEYDPVKTLQLYTRLFNGPEILLERFSLEQLEQGFWAIPSCTLDCSLWEILFDTNVEFVYKCECIKSMFSLYQKLFSKEPLETSSNMWWDSLAYDYCCGNRTRNNNGQEKLIQDSMFECLCKILDLDAIDCQLAALHGLGHLRHPETEMVINKYLELHPTLDDETRTYALDCITGDIM
jgi:hypothetical protein